MKLDKDFLIKQKFWVVLGGGLFLTLLAIFFLVIIAPGAINKKKKEVDEGWGRGKNTKDVKNPEVIKVVEKTKEAEEGNKTIAWKIGYKSQAKLMFWPKEFEDEFEFENGLFATEIAVQQNSDLAGQPPDEPKKDK